MSYATIAVCAKDQALQDRVNAAIAGEGVDAPASIMFEMIWAISASSDIAAAYASALAAGNPNPGGDDAVITDQMILSAVQAHWPTPAP